MPDPNDRISEIYQASRQRLEPPRGLDRRILAEARRAVSRRHLPYRSLALAATVVIGVGLAWLQLYAPQMVEHAFAPTRQTTRQPVDSDMIEAPAVKRRETPALTTMPLPELEASPGRSAPQPASPTASMQRESAPPRARFPSFNGTVSTMPEADTSVAAGAEVAPTATDVDAPCGLGARPADTAAWHRAIAEATLRSDTEAVACLRQAMQDAADDAER